MEELAKLEEERGTAGYATDGKGILADERKGQNRTGKNGGELSVVTSGKSGRIASNEMCTFLILNISSLQLIPVNMIAYIYLFTICCCMALKLHGTILQ